MHYIEGDNSQFERAAVWVLLLKDTRCCKMMFGDKYNFTTIYAYALGIATAFRDYRISEAIKYRKEEGLLGAKKTNYTGSDAENIKEFFDYFNDSIIAEIRKYDCKNERLLKRLDFGRIEQITRMEKEKETDMKRLSELLLKVPGSHPSFVSGMLEHSVHSYRRGKELLKYIESNPMAGVEDVSFYADEELGFSMTSCTDSEDYDCLGRWLCISNPQTGYGLFSKDTWTSDELLPILEKYV